MPHSLSLEEQHRQDLRSVQIYTRDGIAIPSLLHARLEARGIDVDALVSRHIQNKAFVS